MEDEAHPSAEAEEIPIDGDVIERVGESAGVATDDLADVLAVLDAELRGLHSKYERDHDYVTVEGRRAYVTDADEWRSLVDGHDLDQDLAAAAGRAHTEQARLLVAEAVDDEPFDEDDVGIVVGIKTAEEMR